MAWPTNNDNLPADHVDDLNQIIHALHVNRLDSAVNALQVELGNLPKGSYSSVKARLDATAGALPPNPADRDLLTIAEDGSTRWSVKAAPYNVCEEPGVDPTGATNCQVPFQAAIQKAAGVGDLFVPPGTYLLGSQARADLAVQVWPSNLSMRGVPGQSKLKVANSVSGNVEAFHNADPTTGNDNITIEDLEIDLNAARAEGGAAQIITRRATHGTFCNNITYRNLHVHDSPGLGLAMGFVNGGLIQNCHVHDNARDGIGVYYTSKYVRIIGNHVTNCGDDLIALHPQGSYQSSAALNQDIVIANNVMAGGENNSINISGSQRVAVIGNTMTNPQYHGIHLRNHHGTATQGIMIAGNTIQAPGVGHALAFGPGSSNGIALTVEGVAGFYSDGVLSGVVDNVQIVGNVIRAPQMGGVWIRGGLGAGNLDVQFVTIANNHLIGFNVEATGKGINCDGADINNLKILGNTIRDWNHQGIDLEGARWVDIMGNSILSNGKGTAGQAGLALGTAQRVKVSNNRIHDLAGSGKTQTFGINWGTATNAIVHDNDLQGNGTSHFTGAPGAGSRHYLNVANDNSWLAASAGTFV